MVGMVRPATQRQHPSTLTMTYRLHCKAKATQRCVRNHSREPRVCVWSAGVEEASERPAPFVVLRGEDRAEHVVALSVCETMGQEAVCRDMPTS